MSHIFIDVVSEYSKMKHYGQKFLHYEKKKKKMLKRQVISNHQECFWANHNIFPHQMDVEK